MKAKIIRGTTLNGNAVNAGEIIELDSVSFNTFRSYGQAAEATPEEIDADIEAKAKAEADAKAKAAKGK